MPQSTCGPAPPSRVAGVDDHDDLGSTASLAVPFAQVEQRERLQVGVLLERICRAVVGRLVGEQPRQPAP